jgi:hypothetical protein
MTHPMDYATPPAMPPADKRANGLGIASLVLGIFAFMGAFVPFCGLVPTILFALIGGVLGLVGLIAALSDRRTGVAFPIAGMAVNVAAVIFAFIITISFAAAVSQPPQRPPAPGQPQNQPAAPQPLPGR